MTDFRLILLDHTTYRQAWTDWQSWPRKLHICMRLSSIQGSRVLFPSQTRHDHVKTMFHTYLFPHDKIHHVNNCLKGDTYMDTYIELSIFCRSGDFRVQIFSGFDHFVGKITCLQIQKFKMCYFSFIDPDQACFSRTIRFTVRCWFSKFVNIKPSRKY